MSDDHIVEAYAPADRQPVSQAISEAWSWLEREGIVVRLPLWKSPQRNYTFSRRSESLKTRAEVASYRERSKLPKELLHPLIADKVWSAFLRGDYETAVFQAFKAVEVEVRSVGKFADTDYGVDLMRKAFYEGSGPLTNTSEPTSEQQALSHLFAGAIGRFKNPASHRHVALTDPRETFEMLVVASHLMRIVAERGVAP